MTLDKIFMFIGAIFALLVILLLAGIGSGIIKLSVEEDSK